MYKKIVFNVFASDKRVARASEFLIREHNRKSMIYGIPFREMFDPMVRHPGPNTLKTVAAHQELYITAHGFPGDSYFYNENGLGCDAVEVVQMLAESGLTRQIKTIKLWCCNSGTASGESRPLGHHFKQALLKEHFNHAAVYAYTKTLWARKVAGNCERDEEGRPLRDEDGEIILRPGEKWVRPSKVRVKF